MSNLAAATLSRTNIKLALSKGLGYNGLNVTPSLRRLSTAAAEPFLNGSSSIYIEEMYDAWQQDATSVHKVRSLCKYFLK